MGRLDGKVAVITGAGGGMGREAAILFTNEGAKVCAADVQLGAAEETAATCAPDTAFAFEVDVAGHTEEERLTMTRHHWWSRDELATTTEEIWPSALVELWQRFEQGAAVLDLGEQEESTVPIGR